MNHFLPSPMSLIFIQMLNWEKTETQSTGLYKVVQPIFPKLKPYACLNKYSVGSPVLFPSPWKTGRNILNTLSKVIPEFVGEFLLVLAVNFGRRFSFSIFELSSTESLYWTILTPPTSSDRIVPAQTDCNLKRDVNLPITGQSFLFFGRLWKGTKSTLNFL